MAMRTLMLSPRGPQEVDEPAARMLVKAFCVRRSNWSANENHSPLSRRSAYRLADRSGSSSYTAWKTSGPVSLPSARAPAGKPRVCSMWRVSSAEAGQGKAKIIKGVLPSLKTQRVARQPRDMSTPLRPLASRPHERGFAASVTPTTDTKSCVPRRSIMSHVGPSLPK